MISKFEFQSSVLEVDIAGHRFSIDTESEELQTKMQEVIEKTHDTKPEDIKELLELMAESIDGVLGEGAVAKIFAGSGRKVNFADLIDLMCFLQQEIIKFKSVRYSKYAAEYFTP